MRPRSFFYYTSLEGERKSWLEKLLSEGQIYFKSREQLNDINELRPKFALGKNAEERKNYVRDLVEKEGAGLSPAQKLLTRRYLLNRFNFRNGAVDSSFHQILDRSGIFSLSETIDSHVLWGNYANNYGGIVIEFDSNIGLFDLANRVTYQEDMPLVDIINDSHEIITQKMVLTKLKQWEHEQEWRVIAAREDSEGNIGYAEKFRNASAETIAFLCASHGPGYYQIPTESIVAIIMGLRISSADRVWLQSLTRSLEMNHLLVDTVRNSNGSISKDAIVVS